MTPKTKTPDFYTQEFTMHLIILMDATVAINNQSSYYLKIKHIRKRKNKTKQTKTVCQVHWASRYSNFTRHPIVPFCTCFGAINVR